MLPAGGQCQRKEIVAEEADRGRGNRDRVGVAESECWVCKLLGLSPLRASIAKGWTTPTSEKRGTKRRFSQT